jgi:hypothetical protein
MPLPNNRPISEVAVIGHMTDLSTESTTYAVATHRGRVVRAFSIIANPITGADAHWQMKVRGSNVGDEVTVTQNGSAAGDVDSVEFSALGSGNYVSEGDLIEFVSDGDSSTACVTRFTAVIRRTF